MPDVAVVILNWNGAALLRKFIPPLIEFTDPELAELWVADNGSGDDSLEVLKTEFPAVKTLALGKNHGFAEGYNRALSQIKAPYYVLLNSDVEVSRGWLEPMLECLAGDRKLGACMPKVRSWHTRQQFEHAGAAGGYIDKYGYPFCRGRIFNRLEKDEGQYDSNPPIFWASGACLMLRGALYHRSGGLDPFFFAHMEEIDLCWRIRSLGYGIRFCHESTVYHVGGGTLPDDDHKKTYLNFRNSIILLYKNLPVRRIIPVLFTRLILDWIALVQFLLKAEWRNLTAVLHAHVFLLGNTFAIRRLRKERWKTAPPSLPPEMYRHSIIFDFFIRGKKHFRELDFDP